MTASIAERRSTSAVATDVSVVVDRVSVSFSVYPRSSHGKRLLLSPLLRPRAVHAVTDVSFVAHRGDTIAVVGGNGSGKSTLLRAIAGLVPTRSGQVFASSRPHLLAVGVGLVPALAETVFLVSHSASELRSACTRALWMANGALVMQGDVNDVLDAYEGQR